MIKTHAAQPLREPCLVAVANRFEAIAAGRVSERDGAVFREFLRAVAPTVRWAFVSQCIPHLLCGSVLPCDSSQAPHDCQWRPVSVRTYMGQA